MPRLYSSKYICQVLESKGFVFVSQKGSHIKYAKIGNSTFTAIIPANRKEIPLGTFGSIVRQSGLKMSEFK